MRTAPFVAVLALASGVSLAGTAAAQTQPYGTEVCVNASYVNEAKRLFPNAILHVIPDFAEQSMNGWRIVSGSVGAGGKVMTDADEIHHRQQEYSSDIALRAGE